uniref:Uncharacterized protein n=1 Tax=Octopus bimaculoides TaxID=37653 RepID=A0A0L8I6V7_OCTBM
MFDEEDRELQHRDVCPCEIAASEKLISKLIAVIKCFNIPDDRKSYNLSSSAPTRKKIVKDVLTAETVVIEYMQQGNIAFHLLAKIDRQLDRDNLSTNPLLPVPYSIVMADGFLAITDKSKCFKHVKEPLTCTRGVGDKLILSGEKTKRPKDWKVFLTNDENKTQFIQLLLSTWRSEVSADILTAHEMVLICEGTAFQLTSDGHNTFCQEIHSLESSQEETVTRVILYWMYAKERRCKSVRVRSPDSDIFFILLHHARFLERLQILFQTEKINTRGCIDVTKLTMSSTFVLCFVLLGYHAFTRCDSSSAFREKGFACVLHDNKRTKNVNTLRFTTCEQNAVQLPDRDMEAREHSKSSIPTPDEGHGRTMEAGIMKSKWTEDEVMHCQLVDVLEEELEDEICASDSDPDSDSELSESDFLDRVTSDSNTESDDDYYYSDT